MLAIIPVLASLIDGYVLIRNNKLIIITGIISNSLWIYYDLYYLEYITALGDFLIVISNLSIVLYSVYKYINGKRVKIIHSKELGEKDIQDIKALDDVYFDSSYRWPVSKLEEKIVKELGFSNLKKINDECLLYSKSI